AKTRALARLVSHPDYASIRSQVEFVIDPGQQDLNRMYEHAMALVIPTRMEGWGLPAGEALYLGSPVISSTARALQECAGDLAVYFDPDAPAELAAIMARFVTDPEYGAAQRAKIAANRDRFRSWGDVAREIVAALHKIPEGH
ncbi:glycosyltransferase family 4 protein, partial [Thioclava sp. BHET1]